MLAPDEPGRLDPELVEAVQRLDALVEAFEAEPDPEVQERVFTLLQSVDAVHRVGLTRLAAYLAQAGDEVRERVLADPAVRLLLGMYELLPVDAEPPAISRPEPAAPPAGFVPLDDVQLAPAPRRRWLPAAKLADLPPDGLLSVVLNETRVLLARVGDRVYAYQDGDPASPLPVGFGHREADAVVCPWHGCRYDLATGQRLDRPGEGLPGLPVAFVDDEVRVEVTSRPAAIALGAEAGP